MTSLTKASALAMGLLLTLTSGASAGKLDPGRWVDYLDFAYVYSSADAETLNARLEQYGAEAGVTLDDYMVGYLGAGSRNSAGLGDDKIRRKAVGFLLQYLVNRESRMIERSADAISEIQNEGTDFETRYWYHYILAHRALEKGDAEEFVQQNLDMWMNVVIPMEAAFDTFETLSLSQSANSGFVAALPYVFENISRLIVIRSQEMALNRDLDSLAAIVRMLHSERVGVHPDVIPEEASSAAYLDRIVSRLDGPESDAGSLTFTLALFEASKYHDRSRALLASEGFSPNTLKAIDVASGAYQVALRQAATAQGKAAVTIRGLRQLGEISAAKQRLGVNPAVKTSFDIEGAIEVYRELYGYRGEGGWQNAGYKRVGRDAYLDTMHTLWEEIQETSLNSADYYLSRSLSRESAGNDDYVRSAAQMYARYLAFFKEFAGDTESSFVPDSAYFAAYESARGYGDSYLRFASSKLTTPELQMVTQRYLTGLNIYPFDRSLWGSLAKAVDQLGRSKDYLGLARPIAEQVSHSRHADTWIDNREPNARTISIMRAALSDDLVLMYLGFASKSDMQELEAGLSKLKHERTDVKARLDQLLGASPHGGSPGPAALGGDETVRTLAMERKITKARTELAKIEHHIEARTRALPLYKASFKTDGLIEALRSQRDHPVHTLLRRMYYEKSS